MTPDPPTENRYPIVHCDLSDVQGTPGLPALAALAREVSRPRAVAGRPRDTIRQLLARARGSSGPAVRGLAHRAGVAV